MGQSREVATEVSRKLDRLHQVMRSTGGAVIAYSGGIDSTLVAAVAARVLGDRALAITAVSPSLPPGEAAEAARVARRLGIRHRTVRTHETERPAYLANGHDRCYHCKTELYDVLVASPRRPSWAPWSPARTSTISEISARGSSRLPSTAFGTHSSRWR